MKPLKLEIQRTITEVMFVCPKCFNKTIVGIEKPQDIPCTAITGDDGEKPVQCDYVLKEKDGLSAKNKS